MQKGATYTAKAPLRPPHSNPDNIIPGSYIVFLFPGQSLEQHSGVVKMDLLKYVRHIYEILYPEKVVYHAENVGDALLATIRSDSGVDLVDFDARTFLNALD